MSLPSKLSTSRERRVDEVIASYLAALDAGQAPGPEAWLAAHPDLAPELESFLQQYRQLDDLADPLRRAAVAEGLASPDATQPATPLPPPASQAEVSATRDVPAALVVHAPTASAAGSGEDDGAGEGDSDVEDGHPLALPSGDRVRYFGDYELLRVLGRGGMGVVYKARQASLNRAVALKMIRAGALSSDGDLRRFQNEAEAVALLDHPRIVPIFEVGSHQGQGYYTMRFVPGHSLADRLESYRGRYAAIARLVAEVAEAVYHAHCRGVLHRDLKPANVLMDEQDASHVTDFGLAKRIEGDSELTHSGAILGTPAYMAPEQASGRRGAVTTATDVYGVGAILYALLTGHAPFQGAGVAETLDLVRNQPPEPPHVADPGVPRDLEIICLKCLEKEPARRYPTAAALAEDLRRFAAGEPIAARPVGVLERAWLWCRRNRTVSTLAALFFLALVVGTITSITFAVLARREATVAKRERDLSEGLRYVSEINAAYRDFEGDAIAMVRRRLADLKPERPDQTDRRSFEWHLLQAMCNGELRVLEGHKGAVNAVAFAPDGRRVATAGDDGMTRLWDTATGEELAVLRGPRDGVHHVVFSPDGRRLAAWVGAVFVPKGPFGGPTDYAARVWDTNTRNRLAVLGGYEYEVFSLAFAADGRRLATGGSDGTARIWDADTGRELAALRGHADNVYSVAFAPDGRRLATAGRDGTARIWDADTRRDLLTLRGHAGPVHSVAFAPNGRRLATGGAEGTVRLWDADIGRELANLRETKALAFAPDGRRLATAGTDGTVRFWDTDQGRSLLVLRGFAKVRAVAFAPDGRRLATAEETGTVRLWDAEAGNELAILRGHEAAVASLAFAPDGRRLVTAGYDGTARIWDAAIGEEPVTLRGHRSSVETLAFAPDGHQLATGGADGTMRIWDAETGVERFVHRGLEGSVTSVAFAPDGRRLAAAGTDGTVRFWDPSTGLIAVILRGDGPVGAMAFAPDGRRLVTAGSAVQLWDAETGRELKSLRGQGDYIGRVVFAPDGRRLVTAGRAVEFWDADTGRARLTLPALRGIIGRVAFAPDGRRLATPSSDGTARLWDAATGEELAVLRGHEGPVNSVAFAPDGRCLATGGRDGTTRLLDAATGRELLALRGHAGPVESMAFAPDGRRLATSHVDGTIRIWDASTVDETTRIRREAVGLIHFLLRQVESEAALRERITRDGTISDPVRSLALGWADLFWRARIRHQAEAINASHFARLLLRDEVLAALRADGSLGPAVCAEALSQAEEWPESAEALYGACKAVVHEPGRPASAYRDALRWARAACRIHPDRIDYFTLAAAEYRAGYPREALASLQRARDEYRKSRHVYVGFLFGVGGSGRVTRDPNDLAKSGVLVPPDFLAYQAMAHHRLGERQQARAALELVRKNYEASSMLGVRRFHETDETGYAHLARLREAEALILGPPPELPEDVFADWPQPASDGAESSTVHVGSPGRLTREVPDVTGPQPRGAMGEIETTELRTARRKR